MPPTTYQQTTKNAVREAVLPSAIRNLTVERKNACIVREDELKTVATLFRQMLPHPIRASLYLGVLQEIVEWMSFHTSEVGEKTPESLKVLYLCGPEPLNDLQVMMQEGVNPHNVWAVTNSPEDHHAAIRQCSENDIPLKIYRGSLNEFFDTFNQSFDIIYYDACGPFCGGTPNTIDPILTIFEKQRLNSPGALITNFCEPPEEGAANKRYVDMLTAYFAPRQYDAPKMIVQSGLDPEVYKHDPAILDKLVVNHVNEIYPDFISAFLTDLGMCLIPNCRALSTGSLFGSYLGSETSYRAIVEKTLYGTVQSKTFEMPSEIEMLPDGYPLLAFFRTLRSRQPNELLLQRLSVPKVSGRKTKEFLIEAASILNAVIEGHWDALSEAMLKAVAIGWFDAPLRITCDIPLPNLLINSLLGIYGRPWFVNPRVSERFTYIAKTRRMHCDMLILDQCRGYFEWFPTLESCEHRFRSIPFQIVARSIMDRIGRHCFSRATHPFRGAAVIGWREDPVAEWYELPERVELVR